MKQYVPLLIFIFISCMGPPPPVTRLPETTYKYRKMPKVRDRSPVIRVGIMYRARQVVFSAEKQARLVRADGRVMARLQHGDHWRVCLEAGTGNGHIYRLVAGSFQESARAKAHVHALKRQGYDAFVKSIGRELKGPYKTINDNRMYRVYIDEVFWSRGDAEEGQKKIGGRFDTFIVEDHLLGTRKSMTLERVGTDYQIHSNQPVYIEGSSVWIHDVGVGNGYHWESRETRQYPETMVFDWDSQNMLAVINELPVETYLTGVLPSEMPHGFPMEALKAQAVAARSEALSKIGRVHLGEPFDLCADVDCQVYSGLSKIHGRTDAAVRKTRGLVLVHGDKICDAVYSAVCGGHTESAGALWGGDDSGYLTGRFDGTAGYSRYHSLSRESRVREWVRSRPDMHCNLSGARLPEAMNYLQKYFRWEVRYTQDELKSVLERKAGVSVGDILHLVPLRRGVSGRITALKVVGTRGEKTIEKELTIRKALSDNTLWSSCFDVERSGPAEVPATFVLKGAGFGHGVGMCQAGAAMMAFQRKKFNQILMFYYQGARLRRLY